MDSLNWLCKHRFAGLIRREYDWVFGFDGHVRLTVGCQWRLIEGGRIRRTSLDHEQQFGLPAPIDAAHDVNAWLGNANVLSVDLHDGTLDLRITFDTGHIVEVIPDSSGYEAWNIDDDHQQFVAVGGGELAILTDTSHIRAEQPHPPERAV